MTMMNSYEHLTMLPVELARKREATPPQRRVRKARTTRGHRAQNVVSLFAGRPARKVQRTTPPPAC
jgi:hypothetical protein